MHKIRMKNLIFFYAALVFSSCALAYPPKTRLARTGNSIFNDEALASTKKDMLKAIRTSSADDGPLGKLMQLFTAAFSLFGYTDGGSRSLAGGSSEEIDTDQGSKEITSADDDSYVLKPIRHRSKLAFETEMPENESLESGNARADGETWQNRDNSVSPPEDLEPVQVKPDDEVISKDIAETKRWNRSPSSQADTALNGILEPEIRTEPVDATGTVEDEVKPRQEPITVERADNESDALSVDKSEIGSIDIQPKQPGRSVGDEPVAELLADPEDNQTDRTLNHEDLRGDRSVLLEPINNYPSDGPEQFDKPKQEPSGAEPETQPQSMDPEPQPQTRSAGPQPEPTVDPECKIIPQSASPEPEPQPRSAGLEPDPKSGSVEPDCDLTTQTAGPDPEIETTSAGPQPEPQPRSAGTEPELQPRSEPEPLPQSAAAEPEPRSALPELELLPRHAPEPVAQSPPAGSEPEPQPRSAVSEPESEPPPAGSDPGSQPRTAVLEPESESPPAGSEPEPQPQSAGTEPQPQPKSAGTEPEPQLRSAVAEPEPLPRSAVAEPEGLPRSAVAEPEPLPRSTLAEPEPLPPSAVAEPVAQSPPIGYGPEPKPRSVVSEAEIQPSSAGSETESQPKSAGSQSEPQPITVEPEQVLQIITEMLEPASTTECVTEGTASDPSPPPQPRSLETAPANLLDAELSTTDEPRTIKHVAYPASELDLDATLQQLSVDKEVGTDSKPPPSPEPLVSNATAKPQQVTVTHQPKPQQTSVKPASTVIPQTSTLFPPVPLQPVPDERPKIESRPDAPPPLQSQDEQLIANEISDIVDANSVTKPPLSQSSESNISHPHQKLHYSSVFPISVPDTTVKSPISEPDGTTPESSPVDKVIPSDTKAADSSLDTIGNAFYNEMQRLINTMEPFSKPEPKPQDRRVDSDPNSYGTNQESGKSNDDELDSNPFDIFVNPEQEPEAVQQARSGVSEQDPSSLFFPLDFQSESILKDALSIPSSKSQGVQSYQDIDPELPSSGSRSMDSSPTQSDQPASSDVKPSPKPQLLFDLNKWFFG